MNKKLIEAFDATTKPIDSGDVGESALNDLLCTEKEYPLFSMVGEGVQVIRIENDGRAFWRNREIETDDDFRAAMLDLVAELKRLNTFKLWDIDA